MVQVNEIQPDGNAHISFLTLSKQVINYLSKSNFCIPYKDITVQNKAREEMVMDGKNGTTPLKKGAPTHSSIDNVDEETESISLHFTNSDNGTHGNDNKDAAFIENFHPGTTEEISPYQILESYMTPNLLQNMLTMIQVH